MKIIGTKIVNNRTVNVWEYTEEEIADMKAKAEQAKVEMEAKKAEMEAKRKQQT